MIYVVEAPKRHHHILHAMIHNGRVSGQESGPGPLLSLESGFLTSEGLYVDREEAWKIAEAAGQIIRISGSRGTLYSEDLW